MDKKQLIKQYKQTLQPMGVYQIKNFVRLDESHLTLLQRGDEFQLLKREYCRGIVLDSLGKIKLRK